MKRKVLSLFCALVLVFSLTGCGDTVSEIAGNVADAAVEELKVQVAKALEENKVEVIELKTAFGDLNEEESKYQLFVAALIRTNSQNSAEGCAEAIGKLFDESGWQVQSVSEVTSEYLVNKGITFKHTDFSEGNYYLVYGYKADLAASMPSLTTETTSATE